VTGYPITLVGLERARCVVIGGGQIAARKVAALREAGAQPQVIAPDLCETLQQQAQAGEIQLVQRRYQPGDLEGARLVIAATDDPATNEAVWQEAQVRGILLNVVDDPPHCNFHVPATVRRGVLTLSISTGGTSPALARRIRQDLEQEYDAVYERYLALLGRLRPLIQETVSGAARRKALWEALLDSQILELLRSSEYDAAEARASEIIQAYQ
jgi:precorrin-2 dehydrogenase / sirohydrochlorin ferrochelatase